MGVKERLVDADNLDKFDGVELGGPVVVVDGERDTECESDEVTAVEARMLTERDVLELAVSTTSDDLRSVGVEVP